MRFVEGNAVETIYDWLTLALFAGLIVLFLQRSQLSEEQRDNPFHYAPPAIACAVVNYLGNEGYHIAAVALLIAGIAYAFHFLKIGSFR
jgi:hypothetical protein